MADRARRRRHRLIDDARRYMTLSMNVAERKSSRVPSMDLRPGAGYAVGVKHSGYYSLLAMVMNTARTPIRDDMTPTLERFPV